MPAFSGLYEAQQGEAYSAVTKALKAPQMRGIVRRFMQPQSAHGFVNALGQASPASITQVNADRADLSVPGTFTYAGRTTARDVTIANAAPGYSGETRARPADATATELAETFNTMRKEGFVADDADTGVTSPAVTESVST